jgi:hypothetical protein
MNLRTYGKVAGLLLLVTAVAGGFGEAYAPMKLIVAGNAAATAENVRAHELFFRLGFAVYLIEAVCDVALAFVFYVLLRPVRQDLALLSAFFGLVSTALFGVAEFFYLGASLVLDDPHAVRLLFRAYSLCGAAFMVFYGIASLIRGYLMFRSGYIPRLVGVVLAIAGVGFIGKCFAAVLAPKFPSDFLVLPMFLALLVMIGWFLFRPVEARTAQVLL